MKRLLFLCTGNSCRSQMAEGFARALHGERYEVYSAGTALAARVDPRAVAVMAEAGVDISDRARYFPKRVSDLEARGIEFDYVVTVCGHAHETCPVFRGKAKVLHRGFDDPPQLASGAESDQEALEQYRRVRDEIREFVEGLPEFLEREGARKA